MISQLNTVSRPSWPAVSVRRPKGGLTGTGADGRIWADYLVELTPAGVRRRWNGI
jgi:hypothetical protein